MIGRATFPKPQGTYNLPDDLNVVGEHTNKLTDETLVIVEGERLPAWQRGTTPWSFRDLDELLDFRRGNHGGVSYE